MVNKKTKNIKMSGESENYQKQILELYKKRTPEIFADGKVDCERLKKTLGEPVSENEERYGLSWAGKTDCFREIQTPTTAALKPDRKESVDFDNTENIFIQGDNLEALKVLQRSYYGKVKMIYIDPPYNTGKDFIYRDNFRQDKDEYLHKAGIKDEDGNLRRDGLIKNARESGHYHSNWLNMIYPRLFLARNLLRPDGVIFVSIDDNEVHNLRMVMNEIYGEGNFINMFVWKKNSSGKTVTKEFPKNVEYILMYAKNINFLQFNVVYKPLSEATVKMYSKDDKDGRGKYRLYPMQKTASPGPETTYDYIDNTRKIWKCPEKGWRMVQKKMKALENDGRLCLDNKTISEKAYWSERENEGQVSDTLWDDIDEGNIGTAEVKKMFNGLVFDYPKPTNLLNRIVKIGSSEDRIILDFFAGSGTTAHAVMALNAEDGGHRKCISIQLPELTDPKSEAYKAGYKNIADIAKERIRRAGKKIKKDNPKAEDLDVGFKVFKLDSSNFKIWRTDIKNSGELMKQMKAFVDNVLPGSEQENILYELIVKNGLDLNIDIKIKKNHAEQYYLINQGRLIIYLGSKINKQLVEAIIAEKPQQFICLEKAFAKNDVLKTNTHLQLSGAKVDMRVV